MPKRLFDVVAALCLLVVLALPMIVIALWIKFTSDGPILFRQERVGLKGQPFAIFKYRSMVQDAHQKGPQITASGDPRITPIGRLLRKYKLDEIPQLFNVLCGDMSLVGPRPEVPKYVNMWSELDRQTVLSVRPGITDPASIEFRDEELLLAGAADREEFYVGTIMPQKLSLYRNYIASRSLVGDIAIMFRTVLRVAETRRR